MEIKKDIYSKLFEFKQKEIILKKDTQWHNYSYATLKQIQEKLWPVFKELNLIIIHSINDWKLVTEIRDLDSNTFIKSELNIWNVETKRIEKFIDKNWKDIEIIDFNDKDPQWVWSIISYYRRYNLLALLDLEQEDDDGSNWSNRAKAKIYEKAEIYIMTVKDIENWNWKIYPWNSIYIDWNKKVISEEQVKKLEAHSKFIPLLQK